MDIYPAGSLKEMTFLFAKEVFSNSKAPGIQDKILRGLKSVQPKIAYNELTNGYAIPCPGFGTFKTPDGDVCVDAVREEIPRLHSG